MKVVVVVDMQARTKSRILVTVVGMDALRAYAIVLFFLQTSSSLACVDCYNQHTVQEPLSVNFTQADQQIDIQQDQRVESRMRQETANASADDINRIQSSDKCAAAKRDLDACSAQLMDMSQSSMHSMEEINDVMCPKFREISACIKSKSECFKPFERQIIK